MVIDRAIVSTDSNPLYYEFWPVVARAWKNIKIEPTVAVIGALDLNYACGTVIHAPLIDQIPSGFIAQVIRLIIPCFFPEEVSITGDIDMIPLSRKYFQENIVDYDQDKILVFSADAYKDELRYPMCYIAAKGKYFQQIIGLSDLKPETIRTFIQQLYGRNQHWDTDELFFAAQLHQSALFSNTIFLNRGGWKPFAWHRIDRVGWRYSKGGLIFNRYIDAHCLRPFDLHIAQLTDLIKYVDKGSDGKKYLYHLLTGPFRSINYQLKLLWQNNFKKSLYAIEEERNVMHSRQGLIAFSLYGNHPRYVGNLEAIIRSYQTIYPGWVCRIYAAKDVSSAVLTKLAELGCELIIMNMTGVNAKYSNWRFLAVEDEGTEAVLIRDMDSIATEREGLMVKQWLSSDKTFHIIRDHVNHEARIMAGMWGAKKHKIDIQGASKKIWMTDSYTVDQLFLEQLIYPKIKDDVMIHDSFPRFPDEKPIKVPLGADEDFVGRVYAVGNVAGTDLTDITLHQSKCFSIAG